MRNGRLSVWVRRGEATRGSLGFAGRQPGQALVGALFEGEGVQAGEEGCEFALGQQEIRVARASGRAGSVPGKGFVKQEASGREEFLDARGQGAKEETEDEDHAARGRAKREAGSSLKIGADAMQGAAAGPGSAPELRQEFAIAIYTDYGQAPLSDSFGVAAAPAGEIGDGSEACTGSDLLLVGEDEGGGGVKRG